MPNEFDRAKAPRAGELHGADNVLVSILRLHGVVGLLHLVLAKFME